MSRDEASVKQGVILPILQLLGWDPFDLHEVEPEYSVGGRRVDYALRVYGSAKVFLEAKKGQEELAGHEEQLLEYAFNQGVPLAGLTNGARWWMYLPTAEGTWDKRKFYTIDIFEQELTEVCSRFFEFLSKQAVASGAAVETARGLHESTQKQRVIREALPKAWHTIISGPDSLLVDLMVETTESMCGYRPDQERVRTFIRQHQNALLSGSPPHTPTSGPQVPPRQGGLRDPVVKYGPGGQWIGKRAQSFSLCGEERQVRSWKELLVGVCGVVFSRHGADFDRCLTLHGTKRHYFSRDPRGMGAPAKVPGSGVFVETKLSANHVVGLCHRLLNLFGYELHELKIFAD
jgi:hypothetical protein